jgi:allantoicase
VGIEADTAFFTGNNVPAISIQATVSNHDFDLKRESKRGSKATPELEKQAEMIGSDKWKTIVPYHALRPGVPETRKHYIKVDSSERWTHIRLKIFPDGGIARLRVFGIVIPDWNQVKGLVDVASLALGAIAISWSNAHYGSPMRLLAPGRSTGMHDGWETARNPNRPSIFKLGDDGMIDIKGKDWAIIKLAKPCHIEKIIVDTNHYKGNYPESCMIEVYLS